MTQQLIKPEIRYIDYGIGFTVRDGDKQWIELNRNLNKYPVLKKEVLAHEMQHFNSKNKHVDFMIELKDMLDFKKGWGLLQFELKHPKALLSLAPFYYDNKKLSMNWFMCTVFASTIIFAGIVITLVPAVIK